MRHFKRLAVIMLVVAMILSTAGIASAALSDVVGTRYQESVEYLRNLGVVAGYPDGTFKPEATISRAEAAKIIIVMKYGSATLADLLKGAVPFSDVPGSHWASGFIALAKNAGIVNGYPDGTFKPEGLVTYAEFAKMLVEAAGLSPVAGLAWPANYVAAAQAAGMLGNVPLFAANSPAIRGDCAIMGAYTTAEVKNPATGKTLAQSVFGASNAASVVVSPTVASLSVGQAQQFVAVAYDAAGNELTEQTFTWSAVGGAVDSTGKFVGSAAGTATVTATIGSVSGSATASVAGSATKLQISASPTSLNANGVATSIVTARVTDALGNTVVTDNTTKVTFSVIGPATLPAASQLTVSGGVASITVKSDTSPGYPRITVMATGLTGAYLDLTTVTPVRTQVILSANYSNLAADGVTETVIKATIADAQGEKVSTASNLVTFTLSDTSAFTVLTTDEDATLAGVQVTALSGEASLTLRSKTLPGATSVNASATGLASSGTLTVTSAITGAPYKLVVLPVTNKVATNDPAKYMTVKVQVQDYNGNIVNTGAPNFSSPQVTLLVTEKGSGGASTTFVAGYGATVTPGQGVATFRLYNTEAETLEFKATATMNYNGSAVSISTSNVVSASFTVADPAGVKVTSVTPGTITANGLQTATVTAKIYDAFGNFVPDATNEVTFSRTILSGTGVVTLPSALTVNAVSGVATITVTSTTTPIGDGTTATGDRFDATGKKGDGSALTNIAETNAIGANTIQSAVFGVAQYLGFQYTTGSSSTQAVVGNALTVRVYVKDYAGKTIAADQGRSVTLTVTDGTATPSVSTANTVNGVATFTLNSTKVETLDMRASSSGLTDAVSLDVYGYTVGTAETIRLSASPANMAADGTSYTIISAKSYDAHGNQVATLGSSDFTLTSTAGGSVAIVDTAWRLTSTTTPGAIVVSGTVVSGLPVTSVTVNTYVAGVPNRLSIPTIISKVADGFETITVYVWVQDYNGNNLTSYNVNVVDTILLAKDVDSSAVKATGDGKVVNGRATFTWTNEKAETVTFTATSSGLTQAVSSGTFVAGPAHHLVVTATPTSIAADGFSGTAITVKVVDAKGNKVTNSFGTVTLTLGGDTAAAQLSATTVTISGGQNITSVVLTSRTAGATGTVTVSAAALAHEIQPALSHPDQNVQATITVGL